MTDKDIIKALECCVSEQYTCEQCAFQEIKHYDYDKGFEIMPNGKQYDDWSCERWLNNAVLDLINRQQAEIYELQHKIMSCNSEIERFEAERQMAEGYADALEERAKAEAVKEFAERLKRETIYATNKEIDNLVKEMVGEG
jgi:hypothetical protein